jgi:YidC/Oxa1 family membrane protein insertase
MTFRTSILRVAVGLGLLLVLALVIGACEPIQPSLAPGATPPAGATAAPGATPAPTVVASGTPAPTPLVVRPADLKADPVSILAWIFNPIYQAFLILMVGLHRIVNDMGVAIILTTLIVRTAMVPLMRRQMVSMRKMQAIAPEVKEIQRRFKGDRVKQQQATMALYKERNVSQAGCLVALLPLLLILPMYQVVSEGLRASDLTASLQIFGWQVVPLDCPPPTLVTLPNGAQGYAPCIDSRIPWLGGIDASSFGGLIPFGFTLPLIIVNMTGLSIFALVYTALQLVASRMALPPHDPNTPLDQNARTQRTLAIWLPLITVLYGEIIPVGVFRSCSSSSPPAGAGCSRSSAGPRPSPWITNRASRSPCPRRRHPPRARRERRRGPTLSGRPSTGRRRRTRRFASAVDKAGVGDVDEHERLSRVQWQVRRGGFAPGPRGLRRRARRPGLRDPDPGQPGRPGDGRGARAHPRRATIGARRRGPEARGRRVPPAPCPSTSRPRTRRSRSGTRLRPRPRRVRPRRSRWRLRP